jgi:Cd(II)/Pb(II)-responsive transcriptional regulator
MKVKIGELAKMAGCQVVTIRFYEKEGLLTEPERTGANYRLYNDKDIERLRFIRHCRRHGMKLSEVRELLAFKDNPEADCDWINTLVESHIDNVQEQIESLTQLRDHLENLLHKCSGGKKADCGILKGLSTTDGCPYCEDFRCRQEQGQAGKILEKMGKNSLHA